LAELIKQQTRRGRTILHAPVHNTRILNGPAFVDGLSRHIWTHGLDYGRGNRNKAHLCGRPDAESLLASMASIML